MKCEYCGGEYSGDCAECPNCGAPVPEEPVIEEEEEIVEDTLCAYCGQVIPGDAKTCPNCGNEQFCQCGMRFTPGANECSHCGSNSFAYYRQVAYLERKNFESSPWTSALIFGSLVFMILAIAMSSWTWGALALAGFWLVIRLASLPKETDGVAIVSAPGYWQNRYPFDLAEEQAETSAGIVVKRPGVFSKLRLSTLIVAACIVAVGGIVDISIYTAKRIEMKRIAEAERIATEKRAIAEAKARELARIEAEKRAEMERIEAEKRAASIEKVSREKFNQGKNGEITFRYGEQK